ncbi:MAG: T9SS type A sorting domain-containing protein, partial [Bacteroidota bacterium]
TITQPAALVGNTSITADDGTFSGAISLSIQGGTQPMTYLWSNGDTNEDLAGLAAGTYTVTITDAHNCVKVVTVTVPSNTGIAALDEVNSWLIYPNPTHDWLTIDANKLMNATVTLYNLLGQQMLLAELNNQDTTLLKLSDLPVGEYWLKITTDKGVAYRKVMKD